jgi:hypothetical protein
LVAISDAEIATEFDANSGETAQGGGFSFPASGNGAKSVSDFALGSGGAMPMVRGVLREDLRCDLPD